MLGSGDVAPPGRVRRPGGGRKLVADSDPGLAPALLALVEDSTRGPGVAAALDDKEHGPAGGRADRGGAPVRLTGTGANSASLAVESVRRWWVLAGRDAYPRAARLLRRRRGQLLEEPRLEERPSPEPVSLS